MAATTINANPADTANDVSIAAGGTPGARGVSVIVDHTKVASQIDLINTLRTLERAIIERWPVPSS